MQSVRRRAGLVCVTLLTSSIAMFLSLLTLTTTLSAATSNITLVQQAEQDAGNASSVSKAFSAHNLAGDLIVVSVKWGGSGIGVSSITDSRGNIYQSAIGPVNWSNGSKYGQTFYAKNVAGGGSPDTVTVTLTGNSTIALQMMMLEYNGADTSFPLDGVQAVTGTGTSVIGGPVATSSANDLLYAASFSDTGYASATGGFQPETTFRGNLVEIKTAGAKGMYSATATNSVSTNWVMQVLAFRVAGASGGTGTDTTPPTVAITSPNNGTTVSGMATVTATATDPAGTSSGDTVGVKSVQFRADGANTGPAVTTAPYKYALDTTTLSNGTHMLTAVATDGAGNTATSTGVSVTVSNGSGGGGTPTVSITSPGNGASVSGTVSITANATGSVGISSVQFLIDGSNAGSADTTSPYSYSWNTTGVANGSHTLTATAKDTAGYQGSSAAVSVTVTNGTVTGMGPLKQSTTNSRYFLNPAGSAVFLSGSHTWDSFQDTDTSSSPAALDFTAYVNFLKQNGQNATILWHKDLPEYCGWNFSGSVWTMTPWPWLRPGPGIATDGNAKFDLTQFNQTYFDRLRTRVQQLQQSGIYAIVQLFDGNQLTSARCSTDGYPYSGPNNINGVDDGYRSGTSGTSSYTMTSNNAISNIQDAYVKKVIDTLNDLPNVVFEVAEEEPGASMTWWAPHMIGLVRAYEGGGAFEGTTYPGKPQQHPVGIGALNYYSRNDTTLYASSAEWIAPSLNTSGFPENVAVNNQGKMVINDSDHSLGYSSFVNSDGSVQNQNLRGFLWENLTNGAAGVLFMDPYLVFWQGSPVRNTCGSPRNQVCTGGVDAKYDNFRQNLGYAVNFANTKMDLVKATPQSSLSSTGHCLADAVSTGAEYLVYAPSGGTFTVNLSATTRVLNVEWFNPSSGATVNGGTISGGSSKSFTTPFSGDAVLYLVDAAGHN